MNPTHRILGVLAAASLAATLPLADATADTQQPEAPAASRFIVTTQSSGRVGPQTVDTAAVRQADRLGADVTERRRLATGSEAVTLDRELNQRESAEYMRRLAAEPGVLSVMPDVRMTAVSQPNDPEYAKQLWHYSTTSRTDKAWDLADGTGTIVAIIDTGITPHSDLDANRVGGYDFMSDADLARDGDGRDADPNDEGDWFAAGDEDCNKPEVGSDSSWHGTHVAGTIAAVNNNGIGVAGVAPGARFLPIRALGKCGGRTSDVMDAIVWASGGSVPGVPDNPHKADVINLSLTGRLLGGCTPEYQKAIDTAVANGSTVVVAAGNDSRDVADYIPASCDNVITVAAHGAEEKLSSFSNLGDAVDVTAPGGEYKGTTDEVWSTINTGTEGQDAEGYKGMMGTSMSAPHVAGAVALMKSANASLEPADMERLLRASARSMECKDDCGAGLLDTEAAVRAALDGQASPSPTPSAEPGPGETPTPAPTSSATPSAEPTPTSGPTASAKPTPTEGPSPVIANGDFEAGTSGWTGDSAAVLAQPNASGANGSRAAVFSSDGRTWSTRISQQVQIPADATTLSFDLAVETAERTRTTAYDRFFVLIDGRTAFYASNLKPNAELLTRRVDVSALAGRTVTLGLQTSQDTSAPTTFRVDNLRIG